MISAVPTKRSSHYIKGVLIGAMSTMALVLVMLLAFLWICLLSKKERAAKRYTEVKKQVQQDISKLVYLSKVGSYIKSCCPAPTCPTNPFLCQILAANYFIFCRYKTYHFSWGSAISIMRDY